MFLPHLKNNPNDPNSLGGNNIYALIHSKDNTTWIGTYNNGLTHYDKKTKKFTVYKNDPNDPNSLSSDRVYSLLEDRNNNLWVGTFDGGLNLLDRKPINSPGFSITVKRTVSVTITSPICLRTVTANFG
jgi:ligand-binding sensor domain-containing protein